MRKIVSQSDKEKSESRKRRIIVIVISILMLVSVIGYGFMSFGRSSDRNINTKEEYKGVEFELFEDGWHFSVGGLNFVTQYLPQETANISDFVTVNINNYAYQPLYFSAESLNAGVREIETNLFSVASRVQYACLEENEECEEFPIKNCSSDNIIMIKQDNETFISQEENCIILYTASGDVLRASDAFVYRIIGL